MAVERLLSTFTFSPSPNIFFILTDQLIYYFQCYLKKKRSSNFIIVTSKHSLKAVGI